MHKAIQTCSEFIPVNHITTQCHTNMTDVTSSFYNSNLMKVRTIQRFLLEVRIKCQSECHGVIFILFYSIFHFIHPHWCILSVINNLTIIVTHTTYSNLLFTHFYDDMFRSLYDHLQVVSSNFGYSQPCFAVTYSYYLVYVLIIKSYKMFKTIYNI
jgi:hypothetical protein